MVVSVSEEVGAGIALAKMLEFHLRFSRGKDAKLVYVPIYLFVSIEICCHGLRSAAHAK